jgi:putative transposase
LKKRICAKSGYLNTIRVDQGSEIISRDFDLWAYAHGVTLEFRRPRKPTDTVFIEVFNSELRVECLNAHWFMSLADARENWRIGAGPTRRTDPIVESAKYLDLDA